MLRLKVIRRYRATPARGRQCSRRVSQILLRFPFYGYRKLHKELTRRGITVWKLHLASLPEQVYAVIATDEGQAKFWPETSVERAGFMMFTFLSEPKPFTFKIVEKSPSYRFVHHYFDNTMVTFELRGDGSGGTDLTLTETGFPSEAHRQENETGWISVLMNLKAVVDFGVDLRSHDTVRTWAQGYCDN